MRVVCAACQAHYADLADELPFEEKLVMSDALAVYHLAHCTASRADHDAAWQLMETITTVESSEG